MGCAEGRLGSLDLGRRRPGYPGLPQAGATVLSQSPCCPWVERRSIPGSALYPGFPQSGDNVVSQYPLLTAGPGSPPGQLGFLRS